MTPAALALRRLLLWGVSCLLLGAALRAVVGLSWGSTWPRSLPGFLAGLLVPVPFTFALAAVLRRLTRNSDGLEVVAGTLRARTTPAMNSVFLYVGYLTGPSVLTGNLFGLLAAAGPLAGLAFVPQFVLTPAHLELRWSGIATAPWAQLLAAEIVPLGWRGRQRGLRLTLGGPGRRPRTETIGLGAVVNAEFLVDAIRHYVEHPEHRAAIGTEAELRRLREALAGVSPAGPPPSVPSAASPSPERSGSTS